MQHRVLLFSETFYNGGHIFELFIVQTFEIADQLFQPDGILGVNIEKLRRGDAQVIADIENPRERRHRFSGFDVVDIARILPSGQAHITVRYALFLPLF